MDSNDKTRKVRRSNLDETRKVPIEVIPLREEDDRKTTFVGHPSSPPDTRDNEDGTVLVSRPSSPSDTGGNGGGTVRVAPLFPTTGPIIIDEPIPSESRWDVGWVVAISGPMKGQSFPLKEGQNKIGRGKSNQICLPYDRGISSQQHVIITYDYRHKSFDVRLGTVGSAVADLNGEPLRDSRPLKHGDRILLSDDTTIMFIPLCGEDFSWK